jgi:Holliday junction DNA helicase RuvA
MIGSLRGTVLENLGEVLLEVSGVGYRVLVTPATGSQAEIGTEVLLYIHHYQREDHQALYGFTSRTEREAFTVLLATHGVGPALALAVLSTHSPQQLTQIVSAGDVAALTMVSGVGKKTAERLLIELRNRWSISEISDTEAVGSSPQADVRDALAGLGYGTDEIRAAMAAISEQITPDTATAELLRLALASLGARHA